MGAGTILPRLRRLSLRHIIDPLCERNLLAGEIFIDRVSSPCVPDCATADDEYPYALRAYRFRFIILYGIYAYYIDQAGIVRLVTNCATSRRNPFVSRRPITRLGLFMPALG